MKRIVLLFFTITFFIGTLYPQSISFKSRELKSGDIRIINSINKMNLKATLFENNIEKDSFGESSEKSEVIKETIIEIKDKNITKMQVDFIQSSETSSNSETNIENKKTNVVNGKSYIIEIANDVVTNVIYPYGTFPGNEEINYIKNINFNNKNDYRIISNKSFKKGDRITDLENELMSAIKKDLDFDQKTLNINKDNLIIILKNIKIYNKTECASFEISMPMKYKLDEGIEMTMNISGELLIATDSTLPLFFKLTTPIEIIGEKKDEDKTLKTKGNGIHNFKFLMSIF